MRNRGVDIGRQAYELRLRGLTWAQVAEQFEPPEPKQPPERRMMQAARQHARSEGRPWPLKLKASNEPV